MATELERIAAKARGEPKLRFTSLYLTGTSCDAGSGGEESEEDSQPLGAGV